MGELLGPPRNSPLSVAPPVAKNDDWSIKAWLINDPSNADVMSCPISTIKGKAAVLAAGAVIGGGYYGGGYYGGPYAYGGDCYIQRQAFINRFGHRVIRRVRVCD